MAIRKFEGCVTTTWPLWSWLQTDWVAAGDQPWAEGSSAVALLFRLLSNQFCKWVQADGCCHTESVWALMKHEQVNSARITSVLAATGNSLVKISTLKGAALVSSRGIIMWLKKHIHFLLFNFASVASSPSFFYLKPRLFILISFPLIVSCLPFCPLLSPSPLSVLDIFSSAPHILSSIFSSSPDRAMNNN